MGLIRNLFSLDGLLNLLYTIPGILIAISFHEFAHAFAAYKLGDDTAKRAGRMSLSPIAHFDLIGFIFLLIARFGWAKPVPVNAARLKYGRYGDLIVSLAGVFMNLALALVSFIILVFMYKFWINAEIYNILFTIVMYIMLLNVSLCIFNLIPIPPLDGYHVVKDLTVGPWGRGKFFTFVERYGFIILIALMLTDVIGTVLGYAQNFIIRMLIKCISLL